MAKTKEAGRAQAWRTKQAIAKALLVLMETEPFSEITVSQICQQAQVARQTWYRNFASKEDAVGFLLSQQLETFSRAHPFSGSAAGDVRALFLDLPFSKDLLLLLYRHRLYQPMLETLNRHIAVSMQSSSFRHLLGRQDYDPYLMEQISGTILQILFTWTQRNFAESREELAKIAEKLLLL